MVFPDVLQEKVCELFGGAVRSTGHQVPELCESIYDYPDCVAPAALWESYHKIHAQVLPWRVGDGVRLEDAERGLLWCFGAPGGMAVSNVSVHVLPDSGPEKRSGCQLHCFSPSWVSGCGDVVGLL